MKPGLTIRLATALLAALIPDRTTDPASGNPDSRHRRHRVTCKSAGTRKCYLCVIKGTHPAGTPVAGRAQEIVEQSGAPPSISRGAAHGEIIPEFAA